MWFCCLVVLVPVQVVIEHIGQVVTMANAYSSTKQEHAYQRELQRRAHAHCAAFATQDNARAAWHVFLTLFMWLGIWTISGAVFAPCVFGTWWGYILTPTWLLLRVGCHIRAFLVMHDATHESLFRQAWANKLASIMCGLPIVLDGPDWREGHRQHHAVEGMEVCGIYAGVVAGVQSVASLFI